MTRAAMSIALLVPSVLEEGTALCIANIIATLANMAGVQNLLKRDPARWVIAEPAVAAAAVVVVGMAEDGDVVEVDGVEPSADWRASWLAISASLAACWFPPAGLICWTRWIWDSTSLSLSL